MRLVLLILFIFTTTEVMGQCSGIVRDFLSAHRNGADVSVFGTIDFSQIETRQLDLSGARNGQVSYECAGSGLPSVETVREFFILPGVRRGVTEVQLRSGTDTVTIPIRDVANTRRNAHAVVTPQGLIAASPGVHLAAFTSDFLDLHIDGMDAEQASVVATRFCRKGESCDRPSFSAQPHPDHADRIRIHGPVQDEIGASIHIRY